MPFDLGHAIQRCLIAPSGIGNGALGCDQRKIGRLSFMGATGLAVGLLQHSHRNIATREINDRRIIALGQFQHGRTFGNNCTAGPHHIGA